MAVKTPQSTVTVNAAFFREIKEVNEELWKVFAQLRDLAHQPLVADQHRALLDQLAAARDQLAMHFALEEAYGYFDEPVEVAPQLSRRASQLRAEHKDLYVQLCQVVERAEQLFYADQPSALCEWFGPAFSAFDARLHHHEAQEHELIVEAYDADLGVGD
jgi:hypothetical protein